MLTIPFRMPALCAGIALAALVALPFSASAEDTTVEEIVGILKDKGLIDDAQQQQLLARHAKEVSRDAPSVAAGYLKGVEWSGDFRFRNEHFWYQSTPSGTRDDNNRWRYRLRLGFKKQINESVVVGVRLRTSAANDSANTTLGGNNDFAPDGIFVDRAFADILLPSWDSDWKPETHLVLGRTENPFLWKAGKDYLLWDSDIQLEGGFLRTTFQPGEATSLWATLGYFIAEENSGTSDPKLYAAQLGGKTNLSDTVELGARASWYEWRDLSPAFISRQLTEGNRLTAFDHRMRVVEAGAYSRFAKGSDWPVLIWVDAAKNLTADSSAGLDNEDLAYSFGLVAGDKRKLVQLGGGWFRIEANAAPAQFIDSDVFDGTTNAKGFMIWATRQIMERVDLKLEFFDGEEIRTNANFLQSTASDRRRMRGDLVFSF